MFDGLETAWSGERRRERIAGTVGSFALHAVLIGWALLPRDHPAPKPAPGRFDTIAVYVPPQHHRSANLPGVPALPDLGHIFVEHAWDIPFPTSASVKLPDDDRFLGMDALKLLLRSGVLGGTGAEPATSATATVDDPPEVLTTPPVRYPPLLREAGIEGTVLLEFVVDTLGHAEPATIRIISSTNAAFEGPAREAIVKSLYRAGRWRGSPVRALSLERVAFSIQR